MTLTPLLTATFPIPLHAVAAMAALGLGVVQMRMKKGTPTHRILGRVWVALMAAVALSSFFIHEIQLVGLFSPIHLLSIFTLGSLFVAIRQARQDQIAAHRRTMMLMFWLALVLTGFFTFMPGRVMYQVILGVL